MKENRNCCPNSQRMLWRCSQWRMLEVWIGNLKLVWKDPNFNCLCSEKLQNERSLRIKLTLGVQGTCSDSLSIERDYAAWPAISTQDFFPHTVNAHRLTVPRWPRWPQPQKGIVKTPASEGKKERSRGMEGSCSLSFPLPFSFGNDAVFPAGSSDVSRLTGACSCEGGWHEAGTCMCCIPSHQDQHNQMDWGAWVERVYHRR